MPLKGLLELMKTEEKVSSWTSQQESWKNFHHHNETFLLICAEFSKNFRFGINAINFLHKKLKIAAQKSLTSKSRRLLCAKPLRQFYLPLCISLPVVIMTKHSNDLTRPCRNFGEPFHAIPSTKKKCFADFHDFSSLSSFRVGFLSYVQMDEWMNEADSLKFIS